MSGRLPIDIIVPVYRGLAATRRCLDSVIARPSSVPFELVIVDDVSPEPEITHYLDALAARGLATLLRNETNQGFVRSVNRGMALHPGRDVVLLNSDTEVANDWLARLHRCAYSTDDVGTVTPLSNNATLCSYPYEGWAGGVPGTLGLAALDDLCARQIRGRTVPLPTAVGFCMYIRRTCLDQVGAFDAERFGRGYGEENDFCLRASAAGWRHLLAADVLVFHEGGVSFSDERFRLQEAAMAALLEAHPDYLERVAAFHARDPVAPLRAALDQARMALAPAERQAVLREQLARGDRAEDLRPTQLHISHSWGGGTARWVSDFCRGDGDRRNLVLQSRSERNHAGRWLELVEPGRGDLPLMTWTLATPINATTVGHGEYQAILEGIVAIFGIRSIVVSSVIGHSLEVLETGLPTAVVCHDLYPFCPALFACFGEPCDQCPAERLEACLHTNVHNVFWHNTVAADWIAMRAAYADRLARPWVRIAAPSRSVWQRWAALLPGIGQLSWSLIGHGIDGIAAVPAGLPVAGMNRRLRVVVPGRLHPHKGLHLLRSAARSLTGHAEVLLLGCGDFGKPFAQLPGFQVVPDYEYASLGDAVAGFAPDCALLLSVLPESFSYTLSEMWSLGVPVVATRLGAFAERIEEGVTGLLIDPDAESLVACIRELAVDRSPLDRCRQALAGHPIRDVAAMVRDYQALLPVAGDGPRGLADRSLTRMAERSRDLERQRDDLRGILASRDAELAELRTRMSRQEAELRATRADHALVLGSRSWAVTAPLRAVSGLMYRWRRRQHPVSAGESSGTAPSTPAAPLAASPAEPAAGMPSAAERARIRSEVRHAIGIPDASRIILLIGKPAGPAAERFARLAADCVALRNDLVFLLPDMDLADPAWGESWEQMALLVSTRRLFFGDFGQAAASRALAADLMLAADGSEWTVGAIAEGLKAV